MLALLLFLDVSASDPSTLHIKLDKAVGRLVISYVRCVAAHDFDAPPDGVADAFKACRFVRKSIVNRSSDPKRRARIDGAITDFEAQFLRHRTATYHD